MLHGHGLPSAKPGATTCDLVGAPTSALVDRSPGLLTTTRAALSTPCGSCPRNPPSSAPM